MVKVLYSLQSKQTPELASLNSGMTDTKHRIPNLMKAIGESANLESTKKTLLELEAEQPKTEVIDKVLTSLYYSARWQINSVQPGFFFLRRRPIFNEMLEKNGNAETVAKNPIEFNYRQTTNWPRRVISRID